MMKEEPLTTVNKQEKSSRNSSTSHGQNRYRGGGGGKPSYRSKESDYRGETPGMGGHVFQCHSEQKKRGQFENTLGASKTCASKKYVSHIDYLTPIFLIYHNCR